tara:strand:+ start:12307 stop:12831 length:525 start_codon:yes stop_codon:yes gene_type:complete
MKFKIISAVCKGGGIGLNGSLPWNIKEDLAFFSKQTKGNGNNAVIMGRKTWDSLKGRHLIKRDNLILSTKLDNIESKSKNIIKAFTNVEDVCKFCINKNYDDVWVIGGSSIYKEFLDKKIIDMCYITYIDKNFACDTFFPELSEDWILDEETEFPLETMHPIKIQKFILQNYTS